MATLFASLEAMTITVTSPDGSFGARADSERRTRFFVRDRTDLRAYTADALTHQITEVLRALEDGRKQGIQQAFEHHGRSISFDEATHWDANRRRYREALAGMTAIGTSRSGSVRVKVSGTLDRHGVHINPQALNHMDATRLAAELGDAYRNAQAQHNRQRFLLKRELLPR
ncbi:MAG: YbaB/EbfC family nucleoid-associated protein [Stackebrandtia sp.]